MKIGGIIFIIVGAVVALTSYFLAGTNQSMKLFVYVGIAMAVFGGWRAYMDSSEPKEQVRTREQMAKDLPEARHNNQIQRSCTVCKTRNHPNANFCGHCGNKF